MPEHTKRPFWKMKLPLIIMGAAAIGYGAWSYLRYDPHPELTEAAQAILYEHEHHHALPEQTAQAIDSVAKRFPEHANSRLLETMLNLREKILFAVEKEKAHVALFGTVEKPLYSIREDTKEPQFTPLVELFLRAYRNNINLPNLEHTVKDHEQKLRSHVNSLDGILSIPILDQARYKEAMAATHKDAEKATEDFGAIVALKKQMRFASFVDARYADLHPTNQNTPVQEGEKKYGPIADHVRTLFLAMTGKELPKEITFELRNKKQTPEQGEVLGHYQWWRHSVVIDPSQCTFESAVAVGMHEVMHAAYQGEEQSSFNKLNRNIPEQTKQITILEEAAADAGAVLSLPYIAKHFASIYQGARDGVEIDRITNLEGFLGGDEEEHGHAWAILDSAATHFGGFVPAQRFLYRTQLLTDLPEPVRKKVQEFKQAGQGLEQLDAVVRRYSTVIEGYMKLLK